MEADARLPRRERERMARRNAMLAAALAVFAEKGYEQATVEEVAERAEFGKGTLYNYFPGGKGSILAALFDQMYDGVNRLIREHLVSRSQGAAAARDVFGSLVHCLINHFAQNRDTFLLLMKEAQRLMLSNGSERCSSLMAHREDAIDEMEPYIQRAIEAGELKPYPARTVAHMLMGNVHGYLMYAFTSIERDDFEREMWPPVDEGAEFIADVLFDGLLQRHDS